VVLVNATVGQTPLFDRARRATVEVEGD
jgi:hypothetical protein